MPRLADACNIYPRRRRRTLERVACVSADPAARSRCSSRCPQPYALGGEPALLADVFRRGRAAAARDGAGRVPRRARADRRRTGGVRAGRHALDDVRAVRRPRRDARRDDARLARARPVRRARSRPRAGARAARAGVRWTTRGSSASCGAAPRPRRRSSSSATASSSSAATGVVRLWNPAAARITGLAESDVVGAAARRRCWPAGRSSRRRAAADVSRRRPARRALALADRRRVPARHRLRLPRPDRGACGRAAEERLRLDRLARAAHAARGDLRRRDDAAARRRRARRRAGGGDARA